MPPRAWEPSPSAVKAIIPQRVGGRAFSTETIPTTAQVTSVAANIALEVEARVGAPIPTEHNDLATIVTAYGVAAELERAFWPEQQLAEGAQYPYLRERYEELLAELIEAVTGDLPDDGSGVFRVPQPVGTLPDPIGGDPLDEEYYPLSRIRF